jgi:hypothetical protein
LKIGLHLCDLNGKLKESFNPGDKLKCPGAICVLTFSDKEEIFIANKVKVLDPKTDEVNYIWMILVFQSNFEFKFEFFYSRIPRYLHEFFRYDEDKPHTPDYMQIDNEFNNTRLYISDDLSNRITIYNTNNGKQIDVIKISSPGNIIFSQDYIYVASHTEYVVCFSIIYKIRKDTLEVERVIVNRDCHSKTHLLGFDQLKNINFLAYDRNRRNDIFFLVIDENGKTITKYLTDLNKVKYALAFKNMIYIINKSDLRKLEFRK